MPVALGIELNQATRLRVQNDLRDIKKGFSRALSTAVNRTAKTAKAKISQAVRKEITVNKASADKRLNIKGRATPQNPTSAVRIERGTYGGKPSPLITSFRGTKDTRVYASGKRAGELKRTRKGALIRGKGVIAKPRVGGAQQRIKHAFIITGRGGTRLAVTRAKNKRKGGKYGTVLTALYGPTVLGVYMGKPGLRQKTEKELESVLEKNLISQADRLLKRKR